MKFFRMIVSVALISLWTHCRSPDSTNNSSVESLIAANANAKNAVLIIGAPGQSKSFTSRFKNSDSESDYLRGVETDVTRYKEMFKNKSIGNFATVWTFEPSTISLVNAKIDEAIRKVDDNGTLVVIYSGHGLENSGDWDIIPGKSSMNLFDIYARIKDVRSIDPDGKAIPFKPIKRLIIISDSCFSGALIQKQKKSLEPVAMNDPLTKKSVEEINQKRNGLNFASELLIVAASGPDKLSKDVIFGRGGAFSYYFSRTYHQMITNRKSTIGEWLDATISKSNGWFSGTNQQPEYYAYPSGVLNDYIFATGGKSGTRLAMTDGETGTCPGAFGYEWESNGTATACSSPIDSCFCHAASHKALGYNSEWGLFHPGAKIGDEPVASLSTADGFDSTSACRKLMEQKADFVRSTCRNRVVYVNANERLDTL